MSNLCGFYTPTPELFHPTVAAWPFEVWRIDVIGPISPLSVRGHQFILAIIIYFSKWSEVVPLAEVKTTNVINFVKHNIIHRFGVPQRIIHDKNQFAIKSFYQFCDKYRIKNVASIAYKPTAYGLAKAFNKMIIKLLKKFIYASKRDWNEKLSECL